MCSLAISQSEVGCCGKTSPGHVNDGNSPKREKALLLSCHQRHFTSSKSICYLPAQLNQQHLPYICLSVDPFICFKEKKKQIYNRTLMKEPFRRMANQARRQQQQQQQRQSPLVFNFHPKYREMHIIPLICLGVLVSLFIYGASVIQRTTRLRDTNAFRS